jgi:branched-subunit amino acid ABC-type transport system permease component
MLLQQLVNGVMLGSTYALVAIGYTLIFGVLRLLHVAHGEIFMVGAFAGLQVVMLWHLGPLGGLIGGLVGSSLNCFARFLPTFADGADRPRPINFDHRPVIAAAPTE